jgi:zinc transport system substrate-binding protein
MLFKSLRVSVVLIVVGALALAGCTNTQTTQPSASTQGGAQATAEAVTADLTIVAAAYPEEFLARNLAPDATIITLTPPGTEPHDLELTAQQLEQISAADLVLYQKGFQPAVDEAIAATSPAFALDLVENTGETNDDGTTDPHVWLSLSNMMSMAQDVAAALDDLRPATEEEDALYESLLDKLATLDDEYQDGLRECKLESFVTTHEAFFYLAERYGWEQIPLTGTDPTVEPTAARLAEVQQLIKDRGITTIFTEPLGPSDAAETLAKDLGLQTAVLDPIEGITNASGGSDYLTLMQANLEALRKANECQ